MNETTTPAPVLTKEENKKLKSLFSFRARVLVMFCGILLVSQSVFFTLYDQRNIENAHKVVFSNLNTTVRVFERLLNDRFERSREPLASHSLGFARQSPLASSGRTGACVPLRAPCLPCAAGAANRSTRWTTSPPAAAHRRSISKA